MMRSWATFSELPLNDIKPRHWLHRTLEKQRDGLTGHLEVAGVPFNTPGWMADHLQPGPSDTNWWHYEQYAYWVDGMIRCGHLLGDEALIQKARCQIDHVLDHADEDGYLGPSLLKPAKWWHRWPHAIFFRALMADYSASKKDRILQALVQHYIGSTYSYSDGREVCNVEPMLWAYEKSGDERLLKQAVRTFQEYNRLSAKADTSLQSLLSQRRAREHGVTFNEIAKLGAILYLYTGQEQGLKASVHAYRKIDRDQMLVDGVNSSAESLRGKDPLDSHETCDIADYTWSVGYLLMATGDAAYADKIERACFNAAPGAVREDFKALQYFSCPNQVVADAQSNHNYFYRGFPWMSYRPKPGTQCCTGQVNRIMPNYVSRMWLGDGKGGIVAALYGPSEVKAWVGEGHQHEVTIVEDTTYPFSEKVEFHFKLKTPIEFCFHFRIPGWCKNAEVYLNDRPLDVQVQSGRFVQVRRIFSDGDRITLTLPQTIQTRRWPRGGISLERGPLVYALRIEDDWRIDTSEPNASPEFPAWNLYAASPWNYALAIDENHPAAAIKVIESAASRAPWNIESAPIRLQVPVRRVRDWELDKRQAITRWGPDGRRMVQGDFTFTPQLPHPNELKDRLEGPIETVTLVPYGCTKLRITIFPQAR